MIDKVKEVVYYLFRWITSFLAGKKQKAILYSIDYPAGTLSLYKYNYPGVVDWSSFLAFHSSYKAVKIEPCPAIWIFNPKEGDYRYVAMLINIATYKANKNIKYDIPKDWVEVFEKKLDSHIINSKRATHLFIDLWVSKEKISFKIDSKKRNIPTYRILNKNALLLDMQGYREFSPAGDVFAKKIFLEYLKKLCNLKYQRTSMTWEKLAQSIDSKQWINTIGSSYLGEDHITVRN